jgi:hypothetical protein
MDRKIAEDTAVNTRLRGLIIEAILDYWQKQRAAGRTVSEGPFDMLESSLESRNLYERLVDVGEDVPEYAMSEILEDLRNSRLIRTSLWPDRIAVRTHGNMTIMGVSPYLFHEF